MAHALARGFMTTTKGTPDESRSARVILKDVVNAKLLYATPPPGASAAQEALDDAASAAAAGAGKKRVPAVPTATRWLQQMKAEYSAQEGSAAHYVSTGKKGRAKGDQARVAMSQMHWRPAGEGALPDRLVAQGRRVEIDIE